MPSNKHTGKAISERLRLMRFSIIGLAAAAIHYFTVVILVELIGTPPLYANIGGFAVAFWCSFFGHRHWTFGDRRSANAIASFWRFLGTALTGFLLNQYLFYLSLRYLRLPYFIALAIVVIIVAASTYTLSRLWAFRSANIAKNSESRKVL